MSDAIPDVNQLNAGTSNPPVDTSASSPPTGDTVEFQPEVDPETGKHKPVPYDRFNEVIGAKNALTAQMEQQAHELKLTRDWLAQAQQQQQQYGQMLETMRSYVPQQQQQQPAPVGPPTFEPWQPPRDEYHQDDPYEARVNHLQQQMQQQQRYFEQQQQALQQQLQQQSQQFSSYQQQQNVARVQQELEASVSNALSQYPHANRYYIADQIMRTGRRDAESIRLLAKRSHEAQVETMRNYATAQGYKPPPPAPVPAGAPIGQPQDFGDDLDAAHRAALAMLGSG